MATRLASLQLSIASGLNKRSGLILMMILRHHDL